MWHKIDYKELNDDIKVAAFLIIGKPDGIDAKEQLEFNETKKEFKQILEKLSSKEINYVKSGVNTFVEYMESFQDDMINGFLNYKIAKRFDLSFSDKTINLSKKCSSLGLDKEMKDMETDLEKLKAKLKEKQETNSGDFDESLLDEQKLRSEGGQKIKLIKSTVKEIFSE